MLYSIYALFLILSLNSTFIAFEPNKSDKHNNVNREEQADSYLKNPAFETPKDKKILFALHIKKRTKQDLVEEDIISFEKSENRQESLQAKLKKKLQKLREKLQPRKHAIVAESIVLGTATSGAGATITGATVAGFGAGCGAAGTTAAAVGTTAAATTGGITIGGVLTGAVTFIGSFVTWPVVVTVAAGGLVIGAIADEAEKKNKLDQEEVAKKREQEKVELEKQRELEEQRIKLEREKNACLQQEPIDFDQQEEQDFIGIKEAWQRLQQEDYDAKGLNSEQLKESILQSSAYRSFFISFGKDPDDEDDDDEPVLLILGPSIQSNQHLRTGIKDGLCIYVPVNQGLQVPIYIPGQAGYPPLIYVPAKFDNPPCIYVPTKEEQKNMILHCDPVIVIGGGILTGGTIPIIVGSGLAIGWIIKEGVPLLKGVIDKIKQNREEKKGGGGGGGGNNNNDDDKDKKDNSKNNGAQAPGKPTEKDGFIPKNNWDGKKVPNPNGPGWGWPDRDGNVWVPSGPKGHGGAHWDVQRPGKGKKYANIMPGGHERGKKNK